jgi:hypothetical protein
VPPSLILGSATAADSRVGPPLLQLAHTGLRLVVASSFVLVHLSVAALDVGGGSSQWISPWMSHGTRDRRHSRPTGDNLELIGLGIHRSGVGGPLA